MPKMTITAKEARTFIHEDTSRTREAVAGYQEIDGQRVTMYGSMARTVCGHWLPMWDENSKFWRWNDEHKPIDCPACLYAMKQAEDDDE